ncbi:MAG TPA: lipoprotein insertase outer membrane protein LolB [Casimicrobiaceae bacterium]
MIASSVARALAIVVVVAACAPLQPAPESSAVDRAALAAPFSAEGRLSARRGNEGIAGQFVWQHESSHDRIDLTTPLGQTIARLEGNSDGVRIETGNGRVDTAQDWDTLTARAFGLTLPVTGLSAWLRGLARDGSRYTTERDAHDRPVLLRQDGWEVTYAYADDAANNASRLVLHYPGVEPIEVRLVVDRWQ